MIKTKRALFCDGDRCPRSGAHLGSDYSYLSAQELRKQAADLGWMRRGENDYCPECKDKVNKQ